MCLYHEEWKRNIRSKKCSLHLAAHNFKCIFVIPKVFPLIFCFCGISVDRRSFFFVAECFNTMKISHEVLHWRCASHLKSREKKVMVRHMKWMLNRMFQCDSYPSKRTSNKSSECSFAAHTFYCFYFILKCVRSHLGWLLASWLSNNSILLKSFPVSEYHLESQIFCLIN